MRKKAFFAGSFNPFTVGHKDIVDRLLRMDFDVVIGVGFNSDKPRGVVEAEERALTIRESFSSCAERVEVVAFDGLTAQKARETGADFLVRGVRNGTDLDYEYAMASANKKLFDIETLLLPADPALAYVSSSVYRDLTRHGAESLASDLLP